MTPTQFIAEFKISKAKMIRMQKRGILNLDDVREPDIDLRRHLGRGNRLPVLPLMALLDNPELTASLSPASQEKAKQQVEHLGDYLSGAAPRELASSVYDAAKGDKRALRDLAAWMRETIPEHPVHFAYLAVRLMQPLHPGSRNSYQAHVTRAIAMARKLPELQGWWNLHQKREGKGNDRFVLYRRPVDTFDL